MAQLVIRNRSQVLQDAAVLNGVVADGRAAARWSSLFGPSGTGKTVLLRLIAGIFAPDAGDDRASRGRDASGSRRRKNATSAWRSRISRCSRI